MGWLNLGYVGLGFIGLLAMPDAKMHAIQLQNTSVVLKWTLA